MKQSFIILGEGLTDLFEFLTLIEYNHARIDKVVYFHTPQSDKQLSSVAIIMNPTTGKQFQAIYMMLNALKYPYPNSNKKFEMINEQAQSYDIPIVGIDVQPPNAFHMNDLYFKYLISVLRLQNWIPPMQ
ncbi:MULTISPECIES: DUF7147 family protein [Staphylococcus]|uniref:DUF7147 domain-containing protein n=1 Tax=Staphylococcus hominis TaxID=1290 RepID=A0A3S7GW72_STAHO|nr:MULTISPECIES: hypothetical protein [Staphylococcus]EUZ69717.1 hypothetical protein O552_00799 [Staphylococcus sp. M0480]MDU2144143.1 hypothetical protein [Staphylococcus sp.]OFM79365.1 hypothetical protein HMPREF2662_06260 [Staphylococcus sp. HMSC074B09]OFS49765.1 hypothetical protein HMPREF2873_09810 [Staphylococcus sp. HMSC075H09]OHO57088.1 hypothetical protein HMPREF2650_07630 [Staphylococcus sp. HMSC035F02]